MSEAGEFQSAWSNFGVRDRQRESFQAFFLLYKTTTADVEYDHDQVPAGPKRESKGVPVTVVDWCLLSCCDSDWQGKKKETRE